MHVRSCDQWVGSLSTFHCRRPPQPGSDDFDGAGFNIVLVGGVVMLGLLNIGLLCSLVNAAKEVGDEMRQDVVQEEIDDDEFIITPNATNAGGDADASVAGTPTPAQQPQEAKVPVAKGTRASATVVPLGPPARQVEGY